MIKNLLFKISSIFTFIIPIKFLIKLTGIRVIYPFYHIVSDNPPAHIKHLYSVRTIKQFRKDLEFLTKNFKNTPEIITESKNKQNYFQLSFDDGLKECYTLIAPILKDYKIKATFFINSAFVDNKDLFYKYKASIIVEKILNTGLSESQKLEIAKILLSKRVLNAKQIIQYILNVKYSQKQKLDKIAEVLELNFKEYLELKTPYLTSQHINELIEAGHQIGAHSIDHPLFSGISFDEQIKQTADSVKYIEESFNSSPKLFAFPFTDDQVGISFFNKIFNTNIVNYSFGTAGIKKDVVFKNIQRIPIEKRAISSEKYIKTEYLLYFLKKLVRKHIIKRQ